MKSSFLWKNRSLPGILTAIVALTLAATATAQNWTQLSPTGGPPAARINVGISFDQANDRLILVGGCAGPNTSVSCPTLNDVWVLSNADGLGGTPTWTQLSPAGTSPSPRDSATTVYDPTTNSVILFAGNPAEGFSCNALNDVWILSNANGLGGTPQWTQLSPSGDPPHTRRAHNAVYDAANNRMITFGGDDVCGTAFNDVWVLENANGSGGTPTWVQLSPSGGPPPGGGPGGTRSASTAVYDSASNRMIMFGGGCCPNFNDVWVLENANGLGGTPAWLQLSPSGGPPPARSLHSAIFNSASNRMTIFGGETDIDVANNDVWVLSNANGLGGTPVWTQLSPTGGPPLERRQHGAVYNSTTDIMTIFGGGTDRPTCCSALNDTWVLNNATGTAIIPYLDKGYKYQVVAFDELAGFEQPSFDDSGFATGDAGFGTPSGFCPLNNATDVQTSWPLNTDILLRKSFNLTAGATNLQVSVAIDNDIQVFINGSDISGGLRTHEGCASRDSFVFSAPDSILNAGTNLLAVRARDRGVLSYVDVQVTAQVASSLQGSSTELTSSTNPSVFGQAVTLTAMVSAASSGTPTGTVTFNDGVTTLATATLSGGQATLITSSLAVGSHSITAVYSGDTNFIGSTSAALTQTVNQAATSTTISSSANPSILNQSVTLSAAVSVVAPGSGTPTGSIAFNDGSSVLATVPLDASGTATFTTSSLAVGSHAITATYSGDSNFNGSTGSLTQQVTYAICTLYDETKSVKSGAAFPIKLQLCDVNSADVSSAATIVHAVQITNISGFSGDPEAVGNANPDNDFRFDSTLGPTGGYIYNLGTTGLAGGTYMLMFTATGDPVTHSVNFGVK